MRRTGLVAVIATIVLAGCGRSGSNGAPGSSALVQVAVNGAGRVTSDPTGIDCTAAGGACAAGFAPGSRLALIASGGDGVVFDTWTGCDADSDVPERCAMFVPSDAQVSVEASFQHRLRVSVAGAPIGTITGGGGIACGTACEAYFTPDATIELTAAFDTAGSVTWTGCEATASACVTGMDAPRDVAARLFRSGDVIWAAAIGGSGDEQGTGIASDTAGNAIVVGHFTGTGDFGNGPLTATNRDAFVLSRSAADGAPRFVRLITGGSDELAFAAARTPSGRTGIAGAFNSTLLDLTDLGGGTVSNTNGFDAFAIAVHATDGTFAWRSDLAGANGDDRAFAIAPRDALDGFVVGGARPGNGTDAFVAVVEAGGATAAPIVVSGGGNEEVGGVAELSDGAVVAAGFMDGALQLLGGLISLSSNGGQDVLVTALDPATGDARWAASYGGTGNDRAMGLARIGDALYVAGQIEGTAEIAFGDKDLTGAGGRDILVARIGTDGTVAWATALGGPGDDAAHGIAAVPGAVFVTGYYNNDANFGAFALDGPAKRNAFIARLSPADGEVVWARSLAGTSGEDRGLAVAVDPNGFVLVTGFLESETDLGTGPLPHGGGSDLFIVRLAP